MTHIRKISTNLKNTLHIDCETLFRNCEDFSPTFGSCSTRSGKSSSIFEKESETEREFSTSKHEENYPLLPLLQTNIYDFKKFGYHIVEALSVGEVRSVFLVQSQFAGATDELQVAKVIDLTGFPQEFMEEALLEVDNMKHLHHPNIIKMVEWFRFFNVLVIITEYCSKGDLFSRIAEDNNNLSLQYVVKWTGELINGLEYLHADGLLHNDLKTANLFLDEDLTLKIGDFGTSRRLIKSDYLSPIRCPRGTGRYMSPEMTRGKALNAASDLYSLGLVLNEMCVGLDKGSFTEKVKLFFQFSSSLTSIDSNHRPTLEELNQFFKELMITLTFS